MSKANKNQHTGKSTDPDTVKIPNDTEDIKSASTEGTDNTSGVVGTDLDIELGGVTSTQSVSVSKESTDPDTVKIKISYPSGYKGPRLLKQGNVYEVSPEVAKQFKARGIVASND